MPDFELIPPTYRGWHARWYPACPVCPYPRKDHTFPMLDACDRVAAQRRGFKPWMVETLAALGEAVKS
jgi:hypothetical protein